MRLFSLLASVLIGVTPAWAQSPIRDDPKALQVDLTTQLQKAVADRDWSKAIQIVDHMVIAQPERTAELIAYRQRLQQQTQFVDLPTLPAPAISTQAGENFLPRIKLVQVRGRVSATRTEQRWENVPIFKVVAPGQISLLRVDQKVTNLYFPEEYKVILTLQGPVGIPTQKAYARAILSGGGEAIDTEEFLFGAVAQPRLTFTFPASQVAIPDRITVEILGGRIFTDRISLPSRATQIPPINTAE